MAKKRTKGISVDLSNVESGRKTVPEGNYNVKLTKSEVQESSSGNSYISMEFTVQDGKCKGSKLFHNCSLQPQALFNLKSVLEALGFEIPGKAFDLDLSEIIGLSCEVEVSHEIYEGKKKARITEFINPDEGGDEQEGDGDDEDLTEVLEDLDESDLKKVAKKLGIKTKGKDSDDIIDEILEGAEEDDSELREILEEMGLLESEEDDEEESEEEEEEEESDYSDMSLKELKAEAQERGLKIKKGMDREDIIEMLEEDDEEEDDDLPF